MRAFLATFGALSFALSNTALAQSTEEAPTAALPPVPSVQDANAQRPAPVPARPAATQPHVYPPSQETYVRAPSSLPYDAQPRWDAPRGEPEEPTRWYGWQTLATDGAALATFLAGASADSDGLMLLGGAGYFVGAPIVHFAHGEVASGFLSAGGRLVLPTLGVFVGASAGNGGGDFGGLAGAAIGALVGGAAAIVIDAAVLSYEPVRSETGPVQALRVTPAVDPQRRMAGLAVSGGF